MFEFEIRKIEVVRLYAVLDNHRAVAKFLYGIDVVRRKEDAVAFACVLFHKRAYVGVGDGVETNHRFVQNPKLGIVDKRAHHTNLLAHTVRVIVDGIENSVSEAKYLVEFFKTSFSVFHAHAVRVCHKVDILKSGKFDKNVVLVAHEAESAFCLDGVFGDIVAVDDYRAFGIGKYARNAF